MAGLSAAAAAARSGARVAVVEKGDALGGSAVYAGFVWTAPDHAVMPAVNPGGDPDLRAPGRRATTRPASTGCGRSASRSARSGDGAGLRPRVPDRHGELPARLRAPRARDRRRAPVRHAAQRLTLAGRRVIGAEIVEADGTRADDRRAHDAARHRRLRRRSGAARAPHPSAGARSPAASEPQQHGRRASARPRRPGAAFGGHDAGFYGHLIPSNVGYGNPLRVHRPHLLPLASTASCSTSRAAASATRPSATTSARCACSTSPRRARCWSPTSASTTSGCSRPTSRARSRSTSSSSRTSAARARRSRTRPRRVRGAARGMGISRTRVARRAARVQPAVRERRGRTRPEVRRRAARHPAVLRDRGHPGDHLHVRRPADRPARAGARRARNGDPGAAGGRGRCRRRLHRAYAGGLAAALVVRSAGRTHSARCTQFVTGAELVIDGGQLAH